jgi:hypothetical protein
MDVAFCQEVNRFIYSKRVRTRRSGHSKEILEQVNRSNESALELNVQSWEHSSRPDGSVVNGGISLNDISIQNRKGTTLQSMEESSVGTLIHTEGGIHVSLDETYVQPKKADSMSFENSTVQPEREDQQLNQKKSGNGTQILIEVTSSLQQYPYNTAGRPTSQPQYNTLNNTVVEPVMKNITNLNTQYVHNISRSDVERSGNNLSSLRTTADILSSQSLENTNLFAKLHNTVTFSPHPLSTSNHVTEVLHTPVTNSSNTNDSIGPPSTSINPLLSYLIPSTKNSTTPFPELNRYLPEDQKQVGQTANNITYTAHSNISDQNSVLYTRTLPESEPVLTLIPREVHKVPSVTQNISSIISSRVPETIIQTNAFENYTSFHSEASINSTTSTIYSPVFYSSAGAYIISESSPNTLSVTTNSTESGIGSQTIIESHKVMSKEDFSHTTLVPILTANYSAMSLVTPVPHSTSSSVNTSTKIMETWDTNAAPTEPSVANVLSSAIVTTMESTDVITNKIFSNAKSVESVISNFISNTAPSLKTVTSGTIFNTVASVRDVTSDTISNTVVSEENVSSREISSTVQSVETLTSSTLSNIMPSVENAISNTFSNAVTVENVTSTAKSSSSISSTVQSLETVTSNTIPSTVQSIDNETSGAISNTVLSAETSNTISRTLQSAKTVTSNSLPSTVPLSKMETSNATSTTLPSVESVTSSTSSTFSSIVPSMNYKLLTKETTQRDKFKGDIDSGKDESSNRTEEETEKSFISLSDNSNTTSLNVIHEVNTCTLICEPNKRNFLSIIQFLVSKYMQCLLKV